MDDQTAVGVTPEEGFRVEKSRDPRRVTRSTMDGAISSGHKINTTETPHSMLDEIANRIHAATVRTSMLLDRITALGDRAFGVRPEPGQEGNAVKVSCEGSVDRVFIGLGELDGLLTRLEHAGNRINELA